MGHTAADGNQQLHILPATVVESILFLRYYILRDIHNPMKRCSQLVRGIGEKLILEFVCFFQLLI